MFVRNLSLLAAFLSVGGATSLHFGAHEEALAASVPLFKTWTEAHSKEYPTEEEWMERFRIWFDNHGT